MQQQTRGKLVDFIPASSVVHWNND